MKRRNIIDEKLNVALKGIYDNLTDKQKEKVKSCKDMDELMKLVGEWGIELPDELLEQVDGGLPILPLPQLVEETKEDGWC